MISALAARRTMLMICVRWADVTAGASVVGRFASWVESVLVSDMSSLLGYGQSTLWGRGAKGGTCGGSSLVIIRGRAGRGRGGPVAHDGQSPSLPELWP